MGVIYCYTNLVNQKKYIGQTKNEQRRKTQHLAEATHQYSNAYDSPFHKAIRKYGINSFSYEILEEVEDSELNERESYYIKLLNTIVPEGYNCTSGGESPSFSKESKKKLSLKKGSFSEEEILSLREAYLEYKSPKEYYELYKDRITWQGFLNIWCGKRYSLIMPEIFAQRDNKRVKLDEASAKEIKQLLKEKVSYSQIAKIYGISKSTVSDIAHGRTWKNA